MRCLTSPIVNSTGLVPSVQRLSMSSSVVSHPRLRELVDMLDAPSLINPMLSTGTQVVSEAIDYRGMLLELTAFLTDGESQSIPPVSIGQVPNMGQNRERSDGSIIAPRRVIIITPRVLVALIVTIIPVVATSVAAIIKLFLMK